MVMKVEQEKVWAGTEASLKAALEAEDGITKQIQAGGYSTAQQQPEDDKPRLLEVSDGIGVISIKGSLNNDSGFWNEIYGMTGYPEIRDALVVAANDPDVQQILLDIDSGGGAVSGVSDTANLIRMINDQVKPVSTFTDGTMASAAYWLGCAAGSVYAGQTSVVGSIGVLSTHREYSQALKEAGVGVTVIRAGKFKALANSVEKLSPAGEAQIQQVVDAAYKVFVDHVAGMRGQSYAYADQTMAQGQEFVGDASVTVGLVDSITTFDKLIGQLKAASIDSSNNFMDNRGKPKTSITGEGGTTLSGEPDMSKKALTVQDIAAMAAGAPALNAGVPNEPDQAALAAAAAAAVALAATTEAVIEPVVTDPAAVAAPVAEAVVEKVDNISATVQLLNSQLVAKDEALLQAGIKIAKLEEAATAVAATHGSLMEIACKSIGNMQVALGGSAIDMQGMSPVMVVAEHTRLSEQFSKKYPVGGVAAVDAEQSSSAQPQVNSRHMALVNANRYQPKK